MDRGSDSHERRVPSWDGNPEKWRSYRDEVRVWLLGTNLDVPYSIAARLVGQLRGSARRVGLAMSDDDLAPDRGVPDRPGPEVEGRPGPPVPGRPPNLRRGVDNLMARLEQLAPQEATRRGGYMKAFFKDEAYKRRPGERIAEWISMGRRG